MGLQAIPMRADSGPIPEATTRMNSWCWRDRRDARCSYDSEITDLRFGDREIDYESRAECQSVLEEFTSRYARTDETHDAEVFAEIPVERQRVARGIEGWGRSSIFGTKYSDAMGALVDDGKRRAGACAHEARTGSG